jgi:uncharacterized membrane protein
MGYTALKFVHILLAIVAVGFNVSYAAWLVRGQRSPEHLAFALRGVKFIDDFVANPCYLLLFVTGVLMAILGPYSLTTHWIDLAIGLWLAAMVLAYGVYTPTLGRQIRALAAEGPGSPTVQALGARGQVVGAVLGVLVLAILAMMVFKPAF